MLNLFHEKQNVKRFVLLFFLFGILYFLLSLIPAYLSAPATGVEKVRVAFGIGLFSFRWYDYASFLLFPLLAAYLSVLVKQNLCSGKMKKAGWLGMFLGFFGAACPLCLLAVAGLGAALAFAPLAKVFKVVSLVLLVAVIVVIERRKKC